ncbi:MAG: DUF6629 family protein [Acidimicrobiia bacterium]
MCFSPEADLIGGAVIFAIGIDALRHVKGRRNHALLAALPVMLGVHEIIEAFVWWGLRGNISSDLGTIATWIYLLFAFVVLPTYVPLGVWALEPPGKRKNAIFGFVALGVAVSTSLLGFMLRGPVTAVEHPHHLGYHTGLAATGVIVSAYVVAVCGSLVLSGYRNVAIFGVVNFVAVVVLANLTIEGFASLWCAWAALAAGALAAHLRWSGPTRSIPRAPIIPI